MSGFIPDRPPVVVDTDSFHTRNWLQTAWYWMKGESDISPVKTASFFAENLKYYIINSTAGAVVVTLPKALGIRGKSYVFKWATGAGAVTIAAQGTDTVDGGATIVLPMAGSSVMIVSDGTSKWHLYLGSGVASGLISPLTTKGDLWGYSTVNARVAVGSNGKVLTADSAAATGVSWQTPTTTTPGGADTNIQFNDSSAFGGDADFTWNKTTNTLTFGTASYIKGDTTNATANNRLKFQNSVVNGNSIFYIVPNGSSTTSLVRTTNKDDLTAALGYLQVGVSGNSAVIDANILNAGTQPDIDIRIAAVSALNIDITKNAQFKAGLQKPVRTITSNDSLLETDGTVFADCTSGNVTLTLPAANVAGAGFTPLYHIKRIDSSANTVTLSRAGADTIDGSTTFVMGALQGVVLVSDGSSKWGIL